MINYIFDQVLYMSFIGTIAAVLLLAIRFFAKNRFGIKFQYAMDFILIIRLILCFNIAAAFSIYNYTPSYKITVKSIPDFADSSYAVSSLEHPIDDLVSTATNTSVNTENNLFHSSWAIINIIGAHIWFVVIISSVVVLIFSYIRMCYLMRKDNVVEDYEILRVFENCKQKARIYKNIKLIESSSVNGPCVLGWINPKILIPKNVLSIKDKIKFEHIFLHELIHVKKNHILINYILYGLKTIHFFNPIIRYGLNKMSDDMEIVCDLEVLSLLENSENVQYGNSLLDLLEISVGAPWLPQMAGIINSKNKMERRMVMIKNFKKNSYKKLSVLALAGVVLVGGSVLTGANPADAKAANNAQIIEDNLNYDFVNDDAVLGTWESVDFVEKPEDFIAGKRSFGEEFFLEHLTFLKDGKMAKPLCKGRKSDETTPIEWMTWTNGLVLNYVDKTASTYEIKEINGDKYMFFQWKSGDYTYRGMTPCYYVLKQIK